MEMRGEIIMTKRKSDFTLPTLEDLFSTQEERKIQSLNE